MSTEDLMLASVLLTGYVERVRGRLHSDYLVAGTPQELEARKAIARLLRSRDTLTRELRLNLADLFDPPEWQERKFKIEFRERGGRSEHVRNTQIALLAMRAMRRRMRYTDVMTGLAKKFSLSEDSVKKIWGRYRPILEQIESLEPSNPPAPIFPHGD